MLKLKVKEQHEREFNPLYCPENPIRKLWVKGRRHMECSAQISTVNGLRSTATRKLLNRLYGIIKFGLKMLGLETRGLINALDIHTHEPEIIMETLPEELDGYRILHLTDLHLNSMVGLDQRLSQALQNTTADICVLTGDYRAEDQGPNTDVMPLIDQALKNINCRDGKYAVLGNHDTLEMVPHFEAMGVQVLINETAIVHSQAGPIVISGTDDVHNYYTVAAPAALATAPEGFKIALVHSPELAGVAAANNFDLYLCGHTHGGQVCLPGGRPLITHLDRHRELASGLWSHCGMWGYTSPGIGISGIPVRFFNRPEITLITLRSRKVMDNNDVH